MGSLSQLKAVFALDKNISNFH